MEDSSRRPYIVSILVENRPGVLARVAALFSARGYNIEGLTAAHARGSETSQITCLTWGSPKTVELMGKQLRNLVEVIGVRHAPMGGRGLLAREMILAKIKVPRGDANKAMDILRGIGARIIQKERDCFVVEATGDNRSLEKALGALDGFQVIEVTRSGPVVLVPGRGTRGRPSQSTKGYEKRTQGNKRSKGRTDKANNKGKE